MEKAVSCSKVNRLVALLPSLRKVRRLHRANFEAKNAANEDKGCGRNLDVECRGTEARQNDPSYMYVSTADLLIHYTQEFSMMVAYIRTSKIIIINFLLQGS